MFQSMRKVLGSIPSSSKFEGGGWAARWDSLFAFFLSLVLVRKMLVMGSLFAKYIIILHVAW